MWWGLHEITHEKASLKKHSGNISCGDIDSNDDDQGNGVVAKSFKISGFKETYN